MNKPPPPAPPDPVMVLSAADPVSSLTVDSQDVLFSGHQNGQIQEWNTQSQRTECSWTGHCDTVISLSCAENLLVSQGREGHIKIWRKSDDKSSWVLHKLIPSAALIFCNTAVLRFSDAIFLAVPSDETAKIQVFELLMDLKPSNSFRMISSLEPASVKEYGMCMKMCCPAKLTYKLLVGYESGIIALWDATKGVCLAQSRLHQESVMCLDSITTVNADNETIIEGVSASADKSIHKWTITNGEIVKRQTVEATNPGFCDVKIRQDGRIFVSGGWDSVSRVFTFKKLRPLAVLAYHKQSVQCLSFTVDKMIVTGSKDGYIAFWDVYKNL